MKQDPGRWGIHMKRWCREHEKAVRAALEAGQADLGLLEKHLQISPLNCPLWSKREKQLLFRQKVM